MEFITWTLLLGLLLLYPEVILVGLVYCRLGNSYIYTITEIVLYFIKDLLTYLNTLIHELGHILFTLLTGNKPQYIEIFKNGGGLATSTVTSNRPFKRFLISIAGYTIASLSSIVLVVLVFNVDTHKLLLGLIICNLVVTILLIRNGYGFLLSIIYMGIYYLVFKFCTEDTQFTLLLVTSYALIFSSLRSTFTLFKIVLAKQSGEGNDAVSLQEHTGIPAILWAIFFCVFGIVCAYLSVRFFSLQIESYNDVINYLKKFLFLN